MSETPNKILPNSFQTPNFFVDECMFLLTGNEFKCLSFLARKTFGWQKRSDRISKSQIIAATGLANETVDKTMNTLVEFGLVLRVSENNPQNTGTEWALQIDDSQVRFDLLLERQEKSVEVQRQKTEKGRQKLAQKRGGLSNNPPPKGCLLNRDRIKGGLLNNWGVGLLDNLGVGLLNNPHKNQLKPKKIWARTRPRLLWKIKPKNRKNLRKIIRLKHGSPLSRKNTAKPFGSCWNFGVHPPEKPAPNEKGGEYALWLKSIQELQKIAQEYGAPLETALRLTCERWSNRSFDVAHPGAIKKTMTSVLAQHSRSARPETAPETQETTPAGPATLPSEELRARMEAIRNRRKTQDNA